MIMELLEKSYNLMEDEFSKLIFSTDVKRIFQGEKYKSEDILYDYYDTSVIQGLQEYSDDMSYAICGAGELGKRTLKALRHAQKEVKCFLDNDPSNQGTQVDGIDIYSVTEFMCVPGLRDNTIVIFDNKDLEPVFFAMLWDMGFPQQRMFRTKGDIIRSEFGDIYYDLPELKLGEDEVFLDAGSYDGLNTKTFIDRVNGRYKKIYAFEPMEEGYDLSVANLSGIENVEVLKYALSDFIGDAAFAKNTENLRGSRLGGIGSEIEIVKLNTIDNILNGTEATFIKMDIEGAELAALKGAERTLKQYKPKLAISLYHKREDLYEIPLWLHKTVPDYKFYLRHYANKIWDLVLYAVV